MVRVVISFIFCLSLFSAHAQEVSYKKQKISISKVGEAHPNNLSDDFQPKVTNLEMPQPGSSKYRLQKLKRESAKQYPRTTPQMRSWSTSENIAITKERGFPLVKKTFVPGLNDTIVTYLAGGIPNDNTFSIGDNGMMIAAYNSSIFAYDTEADTLQFTTSLHAFSSEYTLNDKYDPKLLYDPVHDRHILVFLNGRLSTNMRIIVCFSTTNNPNDPWNLYALPGNPLNDTTWTDYPAIAVTENELFVTGNLLRDNEPWQTGFSQTIIWQVGLDEGYNGDSTLTTLLWTDLSFDGKNIRNMNPIQGGTAPLDSTMYLLSNRNFTILSDSIFLLTINGTIDDPNTNLEIELGITDTPYGAPPLGRQVIGEDSLSTNDARVLGGFFENGEIQYVGNTIDPNTGFAAVYHGFIDDVDDNPIFTGKILSDDSLDFGYPNIAFTGTENCSRQAIIGFNHTSPWHGAGVSALAYNSDHTYSDLITLKDGEGFIDRLNGPERWGDYFGIQRKYNEPNVAWSSGYYARDNGKNFTYVSKLIASGDNTLSASIIDSTAQSGYGSRDATATVSYSGGVEPYSIAWTNGQSSETANNLSADTYSVSVTDSKNCSISDSITFIETPPANSVFPNPSNDIINLFFELEKTSLIYIRLYDEKGAWVRDLYSDEAKSGENLFTFSIAPLAVGGYTVRISTSEEIILAEKIIKSPNY